MTLSIIVPVYNGELTIDYLLQGINNALKDIEYEVIFVYDCGPDNSWEIIKRLKNTYPDKVQGIKLTRNYGQHNALICGFQSARGDYLITMDEDLQHDPNDILVMFEKQKEGDYDVVYGVPDIPKHKKFRNLTSSILKRMIIVGIPDINKDYSAFRLLKKEIARKTVEMQNSYTFLDGYLSWITSNYGSCEVRHSERLAGQSSYTLRKLVNHSLNIFFTFSNIPIRLLTYTSIIIFLLTFSYSIYIIIRKIILNDYIPGYPSIIIVLGLGISLILLGLGILGEYLHRVNLKTTRRPNFAIREII
jgi:polyisoprenyl-phosphate glycosyltransferase